jgi:SAM-dependent methyltransferase
MTTVDHDYVLGTHDEEIERLELQHQVWRPRALDAWGRAGFSRGQTILDVGCGPGYAAQDLADIVGRQGRVVAVDRSRRFLESLQTRIKARGLDQIESFERDLDTAELPMRDADGAWVRWVFAFVTNPRRLLTRIHASLRRGGTLVVHEYFDYRSWRISPASADFESFVATVMKSWRDSGGEPDIGLQLPAWLDTLGFSVRLRPIVDVLRPTDFGWQWPASFVQVGLDRLLALGYMPSDAVTAVKTAFEAASASPHGLVFTPGVLEIIATKQ